MGYLHASRNPSGGSLPVGILPMKSKEGETATEMNMKRMRGRGHRNGGGTGGGGGGGLRHHGGGIPLNRNHVFDSNGPDLRIRGTAQQLFEKYLQLGRDATGGGDRVMAESYFQHAEHYFRILNAMNQAAQQQNQFASQNGQISHGARTMVKMAVSRFSTKLTSRRPWQRAVVSSRNHAKFPSPLLRPKVEPLTGCETGSSRIT